MSGMSLKGSITFPFINFVAVSVAISYVRHAFIICHMTFQGHNLCVGFLKDVDSMLCLSMLSCVSVSISHFLPWSLRWTALTWRDKRSKKLVEKLQRVHILSLILRCTAFMCLCVQPVVNRRDKVTVWTFFVLHFQVDCLHVNRQMMRVVSSKVTKSKLFVLYFEVNSFHMPEQPAGITRGKGTTGTFLVLDLVNWIMNG
jgi:hypothetical protein